MSGHQWIIATGNAHKVEELARLLDGCGLELASAQVCGGMPEVVEDGATFLENAAIKARALRARAPAGTWILADDSGLEVDALGCAPGIYSARYAGPQASDSDNVRKLLGALEGVAPEERTARFRCVLCVIDSDGVEHSFAGDCEGRIAEAARGIDGFGYDPVFIPRTYEESFAELGESVKSALSHRARAVGALRDFLKRGSSTLDL